MSPEAVVRTAFSAFVARDGVALAALLAPDALEEYHAQVRRDARPQWHDFTAEMLQKHDPSMPLEVAQWQAEHHLRDRASHERHFLDRYAGLESIDDVDSLSATELLGRALRVIPEPILALGHIHILGHVEVGDIAYVLFQLGGVDSEPFMFDKPEIAVLDRAQDTWRLRLEAYSSYLMPGLANVGYFDQTFEEQLPETPDS